MSPETRSTAVTSQHTVGNAPLAVTLQTIEERTPAVSEVTDGFRPPIALAQRVPALVAVLMDWFDEAMRMGAGMRSRRTCSRGCTGTACCAAARSGIMVRTCWWQPSFLAC